jgi:tetratricopeptide (TPR) repeat protein
MLTFLMCLLVAPAPASPDAVAPAKESVVERFIASREADSSVADDLKEKAISAAREASKSADTRQDAITTALKILSPEFDAALKKLAAEEAADAGKLLAPLTNSADPWLAAEAQLFQSRAMMVQGKFEEALPIVSAFIESKSATTVRLGEAWFLKGKLEAGALNREEAKVSLKKFLREFPGEPGRMQGEARATLVDLEEAESDLLTDIHTKMSFSERRLTLEDSGRKTQEVQDDVVALLDEMIEELEKKCGNCKGCKGSCSKPGGSGMGGAAPGMSSGNSQPSQITERDAPRTPWVDLTERQNDPSVFNAAKSRVPVQYRGLLEQYYQSFGDSREK